MPYGLSEETIGKIVGVLSQFKNIDSAVLYGSRAKGNFRPGSDIDLTLKGEQIDLKLLNRISTALDDLLLPYTFDISIFHKIDNEELIAHIERVGTFFYLRDDRESVR